MNLEKQTVLFISHEASRTGAPILLLNFMQWFHRNQRTSFRTVTGQVGALSLDFAAIGPVHSVEPSGALWYRVLRRINLHHHFQSYHLRRLRRQLGEDNIGLIYVNSVASGRMLDLLALGDCPVICHVHELGGAIRLVGIDNIAVLERRKPKYIAVSQSVKNCLTAEFGIAPERIEVVYGFVPNSPDGMPSAEQARSAINRELNLPPEAILVCGCGSIEPRKGTDLFLEVAAQLANDIHGIPVHFVWVGGSHDKVASMRKMVEGKGLGNRVHFVGHKSNAGVYFAASDIFLLTSREDPFPLVVMEAARFGKPIVCFRDAGGASEFVEDDAGLCVPSFDIVAMSRCVSSLATSAPLRQQLGATALRKVAASHNLEQGAARINSIIREMLQTDVHQSLGYIDEIDPRPRNFERRFEKLQANGNDQILRH